MSQRNEFAHCLTNASLYRPTQAKATRLATAAVIVGAICLICWHFTKMGAPAIWMALTSAVGGWFAYRLVNYVPFANFLIEVEYELSKVTWIGHRELLRSTTVVIVIMSVLASYIFLCDLIWTAVLKFASVLKA